MRKFYKKLSFVLSMILMLSLFGGIAISDVGDIGMDIVVDDNSVVSDINDVTIDSENIASDDIYMDSDILMDFDSNTEFESEESEGEIVVLEDSSDVNADFSQDDIIIDSTDYVIDSDVDDNNSVLSCDGDIVLSDASRMVGMKFVEDSFDNYDGEFFLSSGDHMQDDKIVVNGVSYRVLDGFDISYIKDNALSFDFSRHLSFDYIPFVLDGFSVDSGRDLSELTVLARNVVTGEFYSVDSELVMALEASEDSDDFRVVNHVVFEIQDDAMGSSQEDGGVEIRDVVENGGEDVASNIVYNIGFILGWPEDRDGIVVDDIGSDAFVETDENVVAEDIVVDENAELVDDGIVDENIDSVIDAEIDDKVESEDNSDVDSVISEDISENDAIVDNGVSEDVDLFETEDVGILDSSVAVDSEVDDNSNDDSGEFVVGGLADDGLFEVLPDDSDTSDSVIDVDDVIEDDVDGENTDDKLDDLDDVPSGSDVDIVEDVDDIGDDGSVDAVENADTIEDADAIEDVDVVGFDDDIVDMENVDSDSNEDASAIEDESGDIIETEVMDESSENNLEDVYTVTDVVNDVLNENADESVVAGEMDLSSLVESDDAENLEDSSSLNVSVGNLNMLDLDLFMTADVSDRGLSIGDTDPVMADGMTIENIHIEWLSSSSGETEAAGPTIGGAGDGHLHLIANDDGTVKNQQWQVTFNLSGKFDHDVGSVEVVMPAYIWLDRDGNEPGRLTQSVLESPSTQSFMNWRRVGDKIIFTNTKKLSAAASIMLQGTFRDVDPFMMVDKDVAVDSEYYSAKYKGVSDPLWATVNVTTSKNNVISMTSNEIDATIDTTVDAMYVDKSAYDNNNKRYFIWSDSLPTPGAGGMPSDWLPENPNDYVYIRWYVTARSDGSQPYVMRIMDSLQDPYGGFILGATSVPYVGDFKNPEYGSTTIDVELKHSYADYDSNPSDMTSKSVYVWSAYPKSSFPNVYTDSSMEDDEDYLIRNDVSVTTIGLDDMEPNTISSSASLNYYKPKHYSVYKFWDDEQNIERHGSKLRPNKLYVRVWRRPQNGGSFEVWKTFELNESNNWSCNWSDDGNGYDYSYEEILVDARGAHETFYDPHGEQHDLQWNYVKYLELDNYVPKENSARISSGDWINPSYHNDRGGATTSEIDDNVKELTQAELLSGEISRVYTNHYTEGWVKWETSVLTKNGSYSYNDSSAFSTRDARVNDLMFGKTVTLPYYVHSSASIVRETHDILHDEDGNPIYTGDSPKYLRDVNVEVTDYKYTLDGRELSIDDMEIEKVSFKRPIVYDYVDYDNSTGYFKKVVSDDDFVAKIWALIDYNWVQIGTWDSSASDVVAMNGATIDGLSGTENQSVMFIMPPKTAQVKITQQSGNAVLVHDMDVYLKIYPTETITSIIDNLAEENDYFKLTVVNYAKNEGFYINDDGSNSDMFLVNSKYGVNYIHGRIYRVAVWADKSFDMLEQTDQDRIKKTLRVRTTAEMTAQSNVLERDGRDMYDWMVDMGVISGIDSGTWYDLLPPGFYPDVSTVELGEGDELISVQAVSNYKNTGRVLLVVKGNFADHISYSQTVPSAFIDNVNYPRAGYKNVQTITFMSNYSYDAVREYGLDNIYNRIALDVDDNVIGNIVDFKGEPDDPGFGNNITSMNAVADDKDLMTGLSGHSSRYSTVYASGEMVYSEIDRDAEIEIVKDVMADTEGVWRKGMPGDEVTVYEGDSYTYRLRVENDKRTKSRHLVILDSIESYAPTEDKVEDYGDLQWRGKLLSVDVSDLERKGIKPVVYYNTSDVDLSTYGDSAEDADINGEALILSKLTAENGWTTEVPADMSTVHAIAIDASHAQPDYDKAIPGGFYELEPEVPINIYLHMRAPINGLSTGPLGNSSGSGKWIFGWRDPENLDVNDPNNNAHAYNISYLNSDKIDELNGVTHGYIHQDYVKVGILPLEIDVTKAWNDYNDSDGKRPDSVTVRLYANDVDTSSLDVDDEMYHPAIVLDGENDWSGCFTHTARYNNDGVFQNYSVVEDSVDYYEAFISKRFVGDSLNQVFDIVNKHEREVISIPFKKIWPDVDLYPDRPGNVVVRLMKRTPDGDYYTGRQLSVDASCDWSGVFKDVYKYESGEEIEYFVEEVSVPNWYATYSVDENMRVITNNWYPYGDLSVSKSLINATPTAASKEFTFSLSLGSYVSRDQGDYIKTGSSVYKKVEAGTGNYAYIPDQDLYKYIIIDVDTELPDIHSAEMDALFENAESIGNSMQFTLRGGQRIYIRDVPSSDYYTIEELSKAGFVAKNGRVRSGDVVSNIANDVLYENSYSSRGNIALSGYKWLDGRKIDRAHGFRFTGYLVNDVGDEDGTPVIVGSCLSGDDIALEVGSTYNISDIVVLQSGSVTRYESTDANVVTVSNDAGNVGLITAVAPGSVVVRAIGGTDDSEIVEYSVDVVEEGSLPVALAEGSRPYSLGGISFGQIRYTDVDDGKQFVYRIVENAGNHAGFEYDTTVYYLIVEPHDNGDGTMCFDVSYKDASGQLLGEVETVDSGTTIGDELVFRNTYRAEGDVSIKAWKRLVGRDLLNNEFAFELLDSNENKIGEVRNSLDDGVGVATFDPIHFTQNDVGKTFTYRVKEINTGDSTVVYDHNFYEYKIMVYDNGDGTLSFSQTTAKPILSETACETCNGTGFLEAVEFEDHYQTKSNSGSSRGYYDLEYDPTVSDYGSVYAHILDELRNVGEASGFGSGIEGYIWLQLTRQDALQYFRRIDYTGDNNVLSNYWNQALLDPNVTLTGNQNIDVVSGVCHYYVEGVASTGFNFAHGQIRYGVAPVCPDCGGEGCHIEITGWSTDQNEAPVFVNTLKPGTLKIAKQTTHADGSEPDPGQLFHFKVKLITPDGVALDNYTTQYELEEVTDWDAVWRAAGRSDLVDDDSNGGL